MTDDLDNLRPEVREAVHRTDVTVEMFDTLVTVNRNDYDTIRAELLRLQSTESRANEWQLRAERAEAEIAALKARILPGTAKVEIADTDGPDGNPYGWVGGTLLRHDLIGKRVRLVVED